MTDAHTTDVQMEAKLMEKIESLSDTPLRYLTAYERKHVTPSHIMKAIDLCLDSTLDFLLLYVRPPVHDQKYINAAVSKGNIHVINVLINHNFAWSSEAYEIAAKKEDIHMLRHLKARGCPGGDFSELLPKIIDNNIREIINSVHTTDAHVPTVELDLDYGSVDNLISKLITTGNTKLFQAIPKPFLRFIKSSHLLIAIKNGDGEIIKLMMDSTATIPKDDPIFINTAVHNWSSLIELLAGYGFAMSPEAFKIAAKANNMLSINALRKAKCPVEDFTEFAKTIKDVGIRKVLLEISEVKGENTPTAVTTPTVTTPTNATTTHMPTITEYLQKKFDEYAARQRTKQRTGYQHEFAIMKIDSYRAFEKDAYIIAYQAFGAGIIPSSMVDALASHLFRQSTPKDFGLLRFLFENHEYL